MQGPEQAVLEANEAFYRAFAAGDREALRACFSSTGPLVTAHPWRPAAVGREAVLEGWDAILSDPPPIRPLSPQVALLAGGQVALVTCLEDTGSDPCFATNVFVQERGAWRLCHHHGSPLAAVFAAPPEGEPLH